MNRKDYLTPELQVLGINCEGLLCGSTTIEDLVIVDDTTLFQ